MIFDNFWQLWFFPGNCQPLWNMFAGWGQGRQGGGLHVPLAPLPHQVELRKDQKAQNRETHSQPQVWVLLESCSPIAGANVSSDDNLEQHPHPPWPHPLHGQVGQVAENTNQANFLGTSMWSSCGRTPPTRPTRRSRRWPRTGSRWSSGNQDHHHKD